jgi:hypothetical protein
LQFSSIPVGILLGGIFADYVFEPFMLTDNPVARMLGSVVGRGTGSGMAVMFLCTGLLGFLASIFGYRIKEVQKLRNIS